jgi:hypothetical protein
MPGGVSRPLPSTSRRPVRARMLPLRLGPGGADEQLGASQLPPSMGESARRRSPGSPRRGFPRGPGFSATMQPQVLRRPFSASPGPSSSRESREPPLHQTARRDLPGVPPTCRECRQWRERRPMAGAAADLPGVPPTCRECRQWRERRPMAGAAANPSIPFSAVRKPPRLCPALPAVAGGEGDAPPIERRPFPLERASR